MNAKVNFRNRRRKEVKREEYFDENLTIKRLQSSPPNKKMGYSFELDTDPERRIIRIEKLLLDRISLPDGVMHFSDYIIIQSVPSEDLQISYLNSRGSWYRLTKHATVSLYYCLVRSKDQSRKLYFKYEMCDTQNTAKVLIEKYYCARLFETKG